MLILGNLLWQTTGVGAPPPPPPPTPATPQAFSGGYFPRAKRRTKEELALDRARFGIPLPVVEAIAEVVASPEVDTAAEAREALLAKLEEQGIRWEAKYRRVLEEIRQRAIAEAQDEQDVLDLMAMMGTMQ